ncbi:MAG: hypothetical protein IBJ10_00625 [Phycisphaerales bacterium]|nr:hypothetical protein [Phycisphaerales bacterium]
MSRQPANPSPRGLRLYDDDGEALMSNVPSDHVTLLPDAARPAPEKDRIRILWGQPMLDDIVAGRYRTVVCGVNATDNSHGIIAQLATLLPVSQWSAATVTAHARMFMDSIVRHGGADAEPYIVKFDMEHVEVLGLLRPHSRDHFTLADLERGFRQVSRMLEGRRERLPVASVSFLGARSNRLIDESAGAEPTFETVLRTMHAVGYRGDVYPAPQAWTLGNIGVFGGYPFPPSLDEMRRGGH